MTYQRDPLSARYDDAAGRLLGQAIRAPGRWVYTEVARPSPGPKAMQWLRTHGIVLDRLDSGGLTAYERAYQRALYWNAKRLGISVTRSPTYSLQREWGPVTAKGRAFGIRLSPPKQARLAVQRHPERAWWRHPELRSGAPGSGNERFG